MRNTQKYFGSIMSALALLVGSVGSGVQAFAMAEVTDDIEEPVASFAPAIEDEPQEAELLSGGCSYAAAGDNFLFSVEKSRYDMGEKIVVAIHSDPADEVVSMEHTAEGFRISKPRYSDGGLIEMTLSHDLDYSEPQLTLVAKTKSGEEKNCHLYGLFTELGLFVSTASSNSAWDAYYYSLYETGVYTWEDYNDALCDMYSQHIETNNVLLPELQNQTASIAAATTTVSGVLTWIDDFEAEHPLQYTKVEIRDVYTESLYGTTFTNVNGVYSFKKSDMNSRNFSIKIFAAGENSKVTTNTGGEYTFIVSSNKETTPGGTCILNAAIRMEEDVGQAFQISQAIITAARYATEMNGSPLSDVTVLYPVPGLSNSFYKAEENVIRIENNYRKNYNSPNTYASWDVLTHEYGHHVVNDLGFNASPGGAHDPNINLMNTKRTDHGITRYNNKSEAIRLAWAEAYANVFSGMAQAYYASSLQNIVTVGNTAYESYNGLTFDYESTEGAELGEACEGAICGVLWDIYDQANESYDSLYFGHKTMWDLVKNSKATTLSTFVSYFNEQYPLNAVLDLGKLLSHYGMAVSQIKCQFLGNYRRYYWEPNGTSSTLHNDEQTIVFYNGVGVELFRREGTSDSITIYADEWEMIQKSAGATYSVVVISKQTEYPITGPYFSERVTFNK